MTYAVLSDCSELGADEIRFIGAKGARSRLNISQDMFTVLLTYHKVMPGFLEFVFPFGLQHDRKDPHMGGIYCNSSLNKCRTEQKERVENARSQIELCYSLQGPEPKENSPDPWSIRQASVWCRLDLITGQQSWIVVKANDVIKSAVEEHLQSCKEGGSLGEDAVTRDLRFSLDSHLEICCWSVENWHWYLTSMEEDVRAKTKRAVSGNLVELDSATATTEDTSPAECPPSNSTDGNQDTRPTRALRWFTPWHSPARPTTTDDVEMGVQQVQKGSVQSVKSQFSFSSLQDALGQEEAANSAIMVLKANAETLQRLSLEYARIIDPQNQFCHHLQPEAALHIERFRQKLDELGSTCRVLQARANTFLQLVQDRKSLVSRENCLPDRGVTDLICSCMLSCRPRT